MCELCAIVFEVSREEHVNPVPMQGYVGSFGDFGVSRLRKVAEYERLPNLDLEDQLHFNIENTFFPPPRVALQQRYLPNAALMTT
jgi:hypothetical protein